MAQVWGQEYQGFYGIALKFEKVHIHKFWAIVFHNYIFYFKHKNSM